jgi:integrase
MANTFERDGKTFVRIVRKGSDGREKQLARLVGKTKEVSQRKIREVLRDLENEFDDKGIAHFENKDTLDEWLDKWLVIVEPTVKARTFQDYKHIARLYIRPDLGKRRLKDIDSSDIEVWVAGLQSKESARTHRRPSARTVRYAYTVLTMALKRAKKKKLISHNPCEDVENLPQRKRREMTALSPQQAVQFLETAKGTSQYIIFKFAIFTGMRPEEYLGLQWKDLDLEAGTATVQRVVVWPHWEKRGSWTFEAPKTETSRRTIDLPDELIEDLKGHRRQQAERRLKVGGKYTNFDLVFASEVGTPIGLRNLSRAFKGILKDAKLPDVRTYDLRHTFATLLLGAGENIKAIAWLMGHKNETETMRTYLHVTPAMRRNATDTIQKILKRN